jgi:hypothetical protein
MIRGEKITQKQQTKNFVENNLGLHIWAMTNEWVLTGLDGHNATFLRELSGIIYLSENDNTNPELDSQGQSDGKRAKGSHNDSQPRA